MGRRAFWAASGLAALVVLVAVAVTAGPDGGPGTRVASGGTGPSARTPASTTAAPPGVPSSAGAATTDVTATTATAVTHLPAAADPPATTGPPVTAAVEAATVPTTIPATTTTPCRNSSEPACGPFRFDPQPGPNRPMTLSLSTEPAVPAAGSEVVIRVVLEDPDGVSHNASLVDFGDGIGIGASSLATCDKYGPWDPPAPDPATAVEVRELPHVFQAPGVYTVSVAFDAGPFDCTDALTGVPERPYASSARGEVVVVVGPVADPG